MDQVNVLLEPLRVFLTEIGLLLPRLAIALLVLIGGWMLAKLARFTIERALRAINFPVLTERAGVDGFLRQGGIQTDTTAVFGLITYWLVILAALIVAFNGLGLTYVTDLLGRVMLFIPRLVVALLILVFGSYFGRFLGNAVTTYCRNIGIQDAHLLGHLAHYAVLTFVVLIALDQMQVGGDIIRQSFLIILAGLVFALALAFGIGGRRWAAGLLERWWPQQPRQVNKR
jgi:flagellar biosynthesis protein FliQ